MYMKKKIYQPPRQTVAKVKSISMICGSPTDTSEEENRLVKDDADLTEEDLYRIFLGWD